MSNLLASLLQRVIRVRIDGRITQKTTDQVFRGIKKAQFYKPQAVMVTINSQGGSISSAKTIVDILKQYSDKKNTPIYCFAQDVCLNSANIILTSGAKCYMNSMSLVGDFGYSWSSLWFKEFAQKYNVRQQYITAGNNKVKFDVFNEIKPESQKWMKNYLYLLEHELKVNVINNRAQKFEKLKMQKQDIENKLLNRGVISSEVALQNGLVDGIKNYDDIIKQKFSGSKVFQVNKSRAQGKWKSQLSSSVLN